jgi:2-(1,2-epoxy-1,2-dihydrophenyl)acetyl-CoA isomerase
MSEPFLRYETEGHVAVLTMNRPETRNAIASHQDCRDFIDGIQRAQDDESIACIILTGSGSAFSAGGNLKAIQARDGIGPLDSPAATRTNYRRGVQRLSSTLWNCEVPMIAAINGHAIGLGLDLACFCDIRISATTAKLASSFIKLGIVPGDGGAWILPRAVGLSKAAELIFTGDTIDAETALSMGLVSSIEPPEKLMPSARKLALRIAANPRSALRLAKRLLREGQQQRLDGVLELSAAFQAIVHETDDHREALAAMLEKRPPSFSGK